MGIDTRAIIVVGLPYDELGDDLRAKLADVGELYGIESVSPYFDAPSDDCVFGITVHQTDDYSCADLPGDLTHRIEEACRTFHEKTGLVGRAILSPYVW